MQRGTEDTGAGCFQGVTCSSGLLQRQLELVVRRSSKVWPQTEDHRELKAKGLLHGLGNSLRVISKGATGTKCFEDNL